jgi:hypothetical protein
MSEREEGVTVRQHEEEEQQLAAELRKPGETV